MTRKKSKTFIAQNFSVSEFFLPSYEKLEPFINEYGYSKTMCRAIKAYVEGAKDLTAIKVLAEQDPECKRRLLELIGSH